MYSKIFCNEINFHPGAYLLHLEISRQLSIYKSPNFTVIWN